jgi:hypothetical protein
MNTTLNLNDQGLAFPQPFRCRYLDVARPSANA